MTNRNVESMRGGFSCGIRGRAFRVVANAASLMMIAIWTAAMALPTMAADPAPPIPRS